jgi:hypothetical protein
MAPKRRLSTRLPTREVSNGTQPTQPFRPSVDDEPQEQQAYRPTFVFNKEPQFQYVNNAMANGSEWQNLPAEVQAMPEIPGFVFDHNVPKDIPMHCSAEEHDQDVDNDDSDGLIDTQEFVRRVVDSSKVQTIGTYVN